MTRIKLVNELSLYAMHIIPISLPTPFYIGPVNVYLIAEDPVTLIDTGPKTTVSRFRCVTACGMGECVC